MAPDIAAQETEPATGVNGSYGVMVITAEDIYWQTWTFTSPGDFSVKGWNGIGWYGGGAVFCACFSAIDAGLGSSKEDMILFLTGITRQKSKSITGAGYVVKQYTLSTPLIFIGFTS